MSEGVIYSEVDGYESDDVLEAIRVKLDDGFVLSHIDTSWHNEGLDRFHEWSMTFDVAPVPEKTEERRF